MNKIIGINQTRYSSEDLEGIVAALFLRAKAGLPEATFGPAWKGWTWRFGADTLPVGLCYWVKPEHSEIHTWRSYNGFSTSDNRTVNIPVQGPWFYKHIKSRRQPNAKRLHLLAPKDILETVSPIEALALAGEEPQLPRAAVLQIVRKLLSARGVGLMSPNNPADAYGRHDAAAAFRLVGQFLEETGSGVRILPKIEDPPDKRKLPREESLRRMLNTYTNGGAVRGMNYKLWTLRNKTEEYCKFWEKTEKQRERAEKKAGRPVLSVHDSPSDMLRKMAEEYDRRIAEKK